jgi:DNA-binding NtrC family response regulator
MSDVKARILIVDDEADIRETLGDRLEAEGYAVMAAGDGAEGLERIRREAPEVVLLDLNMPVMDGMEVLSRIKAEGLDPTVVMITAYGTIERAVQAMKAGAYDFIPKPFDPDHIRVVVAKAVERERLRHDNAFFREQTRGAAPPLIGSAPGMQEVLRIGRRAADSSATVLLLGESGTGKEVLVRAIHEWSPRRERPFVAVNCVALAENLLESELFGHEKGAFTGADRQRQGRFEVAHGGTLFLDEIGPTTLAFQLRLLRVLQDSTFERVGGHQPLATDVRVIAATNRNLEQAIAEGKFLQDLFYRLNVIAIRLPRLCERAEDIPDLARFFLRKFVHEAKREVVGFAETALACLSAYAWPGNVRELENAIERAVVLGLDEEIWPEDLPEQILAAASSREQGALPGYHAAVEEQKRRIIREALEQYNGNQSRAAERLGLQRTYLSRLIKNLDLR